MILRSTQKDGIRHTLERRTVKGGYGDATKWLFVITDEVGDLYAFTHKIDAEYEWKRMFGALALRVAA